MIACGGGKNGSGNQANFAVASSQMVRNTPSANSHGARARSPPPKRPSHFALVVAVRMPPAITKAATARLGVRDQSPKSSHSRQDNPNATHARLANTPVLLARNDAG